MKFKIRKKTYGDGIVLYYPMIKKGFWSSWDYMYIDPGVMAWLDGYKGRRKFSSKIGDAKKAIDRYKKAIHDAKMPAIYPISPTSLDAASYNLID